MTKNLLALSLTVLAISACGGGGSDSNPAEPPQPVTKAEGAYVGKFHSTAFPQGAIQVVVLENDDFWGLYGNANAAGDLVVYGIVQGQGKSDNGSFSATGRDYFYTGATSAGSVSAQYVAGTSISGTINAAGQNATFAVTTAAAMPYNYNSPANLAVLSGNWAGVTLQGAPFSLNIGNNGAYNGTSEGCAMSGTITPRTSGKNVFDVALRFGSAPCLLPNASIKGIALAIPLANGKTQLVAAGIDTARTIGSALFAVR